MIIFYILVLSIFVVISTSAYIMYWGNEVANYTNHFVTLGVIPFMYGFLLGYILTTSLKEKGIISRNIRIYIALFVGVLALIPALVLVIVMYQPHT